MSRTLITHFYNEEYLLPWWLKHHLNYFDQAILIDHGSTDDSVDICRTLAPHWRVVKSRLYEFDAYLTDLEVMHYEQDILGWKIALTITEFLAPAFPLDQIEKIMESSGRMGFTITGRSIFDNEPDRTFDPNVPLLKNFRFGLDDNNLDQNTRIQLNWGSLPSYRNRFYHRLPAGMYTTGRHMSHHPDANMRINEVVNYSLGYAPWNDPGRARKLQFSHKIPKTEYGRQTGSHHMRTAEMLQQDYEKVAPHVTDFSNLPYYSQYISQLQNYA